MKSIEIEHLRKYYGEVKAVDDVTFSVEEGEFFAFLGANGAGKSTTISVLSGREPRDGGEVRILGVPVEERPDDVKRAIGVVFQESVLDRTFTVYENLRDRAALYGIPSRRFDEKLRELSELFELGPLLKRRLGKLSGGQRRRVDIARALVHDPKILILDEPTTGLDPQTRRGVWRVIHAMRRVRGITVFLTTHYMEEAADADRVVILDGGKVLANDTPHNLKEKYAGDYITLYGAEEEAAKLGLPYVRAGDGFRIRVDRTAQATELILRSPALFVDYEITKGDMDDVFLAVTGKRIGGEGE